jgi:plasmid replication initiation protein
MDKELIIKHNAVIKAAYRMTLSEQRMMLLCIAKIRRDKDDNSRHFTISHDDYCSKFSIDSKNAYSDMFDAAKRLQQRLITINGNVVIRGESWEGMCISLLSARRWNAGEGKIGLSFSKEFMPLLEQLSSDFTSFNLKDVAEMKSVYAIRFYELIKMAYGQQRTNSGKPFLMLKISEIREMFELQGKYVRYQSLNARVIEPAISDINKYSPFRVSSEKVKKGRNIHAIKFLIDKKSTQLELKNTKNKRAVEKAIAELKEAFTQKRGITLLGKKVIDINGSIISFDNNTSSNIYMALVESDANFTVG